MYPRCQALMRFKSCRGHYLVALAVSSLAQDPRACVSRALLPCLSRLWIAKVCHTGVRQDTLAFSGRPRETNLASMEFSLLALSQNREAALGEHGCISRHAKEILWMHQVDDRKKNIAFLICFETRINCLTL